MKTLAAIKNELFQDYVKLVSTDNLAETLDNPLIPVPFTCVASVRNEHSDALMAEINKFFEHKKLKNKDFLALDDNDISHLHFLFNLLNISSGVTQDIVKATVETKLASSPKAEIKKEIEKVEVAKEKIEEPKKNEDSTSEIKVESTVEISSIENNTNSDTILELGIPVRSPITLIKDEKISAIIIDEKTIEFEGEELSITDGTKKAFKKAGVTGMALGLANWNYNGQSLKSLKDTINNS